MVKKNINYEEPRLRWVSLGCRVTLCANSPMEGDTGNEDYGDGGDISDNF